MKSGAVVVTLTFEETGDEVVLMKDSNGQVIGFEKLNYAILSTANLKISFEAATA